MEFHVRTSGERETDGKGRSLLRRRKESQFLVSPFVLA